MKAFYTAVLINLFFFIFRVLYVLYYPIDLSPEEAQYWDWSRELDLSYYSKPPMVAYLNAVTTYLFGNTELGVRITPITLSFLLSLFLFFFTRKLFDEKVAFFASVLPNLYVGTAINSILMTTDAPFIFFWAISVMLIYVAVERNSVWLWISVGVSAGLSFLSKYPAVFLLPLTLVYIALVKKDLLFSLRPYLSLIPAFILSLPVLVWNFQKDFVSFKHVSSLASKGSHFPNFSTFLEFLGGQLLLLSVIPFILLLLGWWKTFRERDAKLIFLTTYSLPIFLFFTILSLKKEVYANWSGFAYFTGSLLASIYMKELYERRKILFSATLLFCSILVLLLHFTPIFDYIGMRKLLPPKRDPVKVMIGWEKLGKEVGKFYSGKELVFSTAYQISAELAFYVKGNPRTFVYHFGRMTQYYLWEDRLPQFKGRDAIFVAEWGIPREVRRHFLSYELLREVHVLWRGDRIATFKIYKLRGFDGSFGDKPKGF